MSNSYRHNSPKGTVRLLQDIAKLFNNRQGSDVQFKVGGGITDESSQLIGETIYDASATVTMYAHSAILRCRSHHFAAMFENDKGFREHSDGVIHIPNMSPSVVYKILDYIYTGDMHVRVDILLGVIIAAEEMELEELSIKCQDNVMSVLEQTLMESEDIEEENQQRLPIDVAVSKILLPALTFAHSHSMPRFFHQLFYFTISNINMFLTSADTCFAFFERIPINIARQILASDELEIQEYDIWKFAFNLACYKTKVLESAVETHFRLENVNDQEKLETSEGYNSEQALISEEQLKQFRINLTPLLPTIRFSLLESGQYERIVNILSYVLPTRRLFELQKFYVQPDKLRLMDIPRRSPFSKIISKVGLWQLIKMWIFKSNEIKECHSARLIKLKRLFRASEHAFLAEAFHEHCDDKGPTIVIVKSVDGYLFGGVNFADWESNSNWSGSISNFLFALADGYHRKISAKFSYYDKDDELYAARNFPYSGPIFGAGRDLIIAGKANIALSSSQMPVSYSGAGASCTALAGKMQFLVEDYEVFAIS